MTAQELKGYLLQYQQSKERAQEIELHLAELKYEAVKLKSHEGTKVELDAAVGLYLDACADSAAELSRLANLRKKIIATIDNVQDIKMRSVLWRKYILGERWHDVSEHLHLDDRWVRRLHEKALETVAKKLTLESPPKPVL